MSILLRDVKTGLVFRGTFETLDGLIGYRDERFPDAHWNSQGFHSATMWRRATNPALRGAIAPTAMCNAIIMPFLERRQ